MADGLTENHSLNNLKEKLEFIHEIQEYQIEELLSSITMKIGADTAAVRPACALIAMRAAI